MSGWRYPLGGPLIASLFIWALSWLLFFPPLLWVWATIHVFNWHPLTSSPYDMIRSQVGAQANFQALKSLARGAVYCFPDHGDLKKKWEGSIIANDPYLPLSAIKYPDRLMNPFLHRQDEEAAGRYGLSPLHIICLTHKIPPRSADDKRCHAHRQPDHPSL